MFIFRLLIFLKINFFEKKKLSGIPSDCQTVWIQIRPDVLSGLIRVQTVCESYQQTTLGNKELNMHTVSPVIFFKINFFDFFFRNTIRVSYGLVPDKARRIVGPDLGQNCLKKLSADDTRR